MWLSALRAQRLKVNLEILHSLLIGRHFFPPLAPPPHLFSPLTSNISLCPLPDENQSLDFEFALRLCGDSAAGCQGLSKAPAQKVPGCRWFGVLKLGNGDTLRLQISCRADCGLRGCNLLRQASLETSAQCSLPHGFKTVLKQRSLV